MPSGTKPTDQFSQPPLQKQPFVKSRLDPASSRLIALVLGIVGGILGVLLGFVILQAGTLAQSLGISQSTFAIGIGVSAILVGVLGIVGGSLAASNPDLSKWCAAIASVCFLVIALADGSITWALSAILLFVGFVLAKDASITPVKAVLASFGDPSLPVAGWYPDPNQPQKLRFWDGAHWTDFRAGMKS